MNNEPQHSGGASRPNTDGGSPYTQFPTPQKNPIKPHKTKSKRRFHIWPQKWSTKKKRIATGILAAILVLLAGFATWFFFLRSDKPVQEQAAQQEVVPPPTTEKSHLTGEEVPIGSNAMTVVGVMIENSPDARPQSGLREAGVVFEAVAEGGITRFLALYQQNQPEYIGPVRSARPYFVEWVLPFNAGYAHVGGSPEALALIKALGVKDLDQFSNSGAFQRINSRYAPHNVYSSVPALENLIKQKGLEGSNFTGFVRKDPAPVSPAPARAIDLAISSALYNVHYDYDAASNTYLRSLGGRPHTDERSGAQISPKVVVALVMPSSLAADRTHTVYQTIGSGSMYVFQDGAVTTGTWSKASPQTQFTFTDANGHALALNPGQTWITMVKDASSVVYAP